MNLSSKQLIRFTILGAVGLATAWPQVPENDTIVRDVVVIGGGSSGTYTAIGLRDLNQSVVVIERKDRLGGHTETYQDPVSKGFDNIGVVVWHDLPLVRSYFSRFNVPLKPIGSGFGGITNKYIDFRTGKIVASYTPPDPAAALAAYGVQLAKYPYLNEGFVLPDPVPADLLLPFGDFVKKYSIGDAVQTIFGYGQGTGDILNISTLYVAKVIGLDTLRCITTGAFLTAASGDNSEIYEKARAELGSDALLQSTVVAISRGGSKVKVLVATPSGLKIILARKVVITIPPKLNNLQGFDLSESERSLFSEFRNAAYYTGVLNNTGLPDNVSATDVGADTAYNLPALPGVYGFYPSGLPGLFDVKYGSPFVELPESKVKADIIATLLRLQNAGLATKTPEFVDYSAHVPFELTVSREAISNGFYKQLYALQGQRHTFYTGAAFDAHDSSILWNFTRTLLPRIAA